VQYRADYIGLGCGPLLPFGFRVPAGFNFSVTNNLEIRPLFPGGNPGMSLWLQNVRTGEQIGRRRFDPQGRNMGNKGFTKAHGQADRPVGTFEDYEFRCNFSDYAVSTGGSMSLKIGPLPQLTPSQPGVGCFGKAPEFR